MARRASGNKVIQVDGELVAEIGAGRTGDVTNENPSGGGGSGVISAWATATTYTAGQPVTNGGNTYTAVDSHTSGATFAGDLAAHWTLLPLTAAAGAAQKSANLSDLASAATARTNLGAGVASGLATLDSSARIPIGQLPAGVSQPRLTALSTFGGIPMSSRQQKDSIATLVSNGTDTGQNSRTRHPIPAQSVSLAPMFWNRSSASTNAITIPILVSAAMEYPAGVYHEVLFKGAKTITIDPGGIVVGDPISCGLTPAGALAFVKTWVRTAGGSTASGAFPYTVYTASGKGEGSVTTTTGNAPSDQTKAAITASTGVAFGPVQVIGSPVSANPSLGAIGDSILVATNSDSGASGDYINAGFIGRAINNAYAWMNLGIAGDTTANALAMSAIDNRLALLLSFPNAVWEHGSNDLMIGAGTLATFVANELSAWNLSYNAGQRVFKTTCTPVTTSSDSWATTTNQTPGTTNANAGEPARQCWNAFLRSGAPLTGTGAPIQGIGSITSGSASVTSVTGSFVNGQTICGWGIPIGTTVLSGGGTATLTLSANATATRATIPLLAGTILIGTSPHPLYAVWDSAATIESTTAGVLGAGGSVWKAGPATTGDGTHPNSAGFILMAVAVTLTQLAS